jgi:hypothetical protein
MWGEILGERSKYSNPGLHRFFQKSKASAAVYPNSSVFWVITQRRLVKHRRFGTAYRSRLDTTLEDGTVRFTGNVGA